MFKDILVPMVTGDFPEAAIRAACNIAESSRAHVDALVGVSMIAPNAAVWAYYPEGFYESLKEAAEATIAALARRVDERLAAETIPHGVRRCSTLWLTTTEMATLCARYADLIVLGRGDATSGTDQRLLGGLLAGSGRPLLLVPEEAGDTDWKGHAIVAWKPSSEATRALHDALPLLLGARSVHLLQVEDEADTETDAGVDQERLLAHLSRHGIPAQVVRRRHDHHSTTQCILDHAAATRASLIVAGGYSHSRAREQLFGGVTRGLFERASCPVLFSH